ncbi:unnamed protein product [Phytophthora lilii]|uniref:Unnamed protein product n=1 Tax=Phytophthora lilii TaxID=2077276 RepID=A0A9W6UDC2_9STRA|nr:unnamed protein product [Phytophthora lilii]
MFLKRVKLQEQGRLQGAVYGARSVFDALGPIIFSSLYAAMTRQSIWSQALPYVVASVIFLVGIAVAFALPVGKTASSSKIIATPAPLPSPTCGESPSSSSVYFETDDDDDDMEEGDGGQMAYTSGTVLESNHFLAEPLLGNSSTTAHTHADV